jgi:hypothetical protein
MLLVGRRQLIDLSLILVDPLLGSAQLNCSPCEYQTDPVRLIDPILEMHGLLQGVMTSGVALVGLWAIEEAMTLRSNPEDYV